MGHDERPDGESDMTADNIAPEDVPTHDPANTQVGAHDDQNDTHDEKEDEA